MKTATVSLRKRSIRYIGRILALTICTLAVLRAGPIYATSIFSNSHSYSFSGDPTAVIIDVEIFDNFNGDFNKYLWQYTVTNNSFNPNPGTSNGFSGFETALPINVPDLGDIFAPNANWEFNCCSGQAVEWDIKNSDGLGVMPGQSGIFGFTSLPRQITNSTGWFHTWQFDSQTDITNYPLGDGPEVPNVLLPPINLVPEPSTILLLCSGFVGIGIRRWRHSQVSH